MHQGIHKKRKRIIDQELLDFIKTCPCIISGETPSDPDHIVTKGSGGDDVANNVWPIAHRFHQERHLIGLITFINKYRACRIWLELAGRHDILEKLNYRNMGGLNV